MNANERYTQLCKLLGDITYKISHLEAAKEEILNQIKELEKGEVNAVKKY